MLLELYIENFGIIDRLRLSFPPGLNVLTGETGAGKSMVIDAVEVVVGARASPDLIRTGQDRAVIEATFDLSDCERARKLLAEHGVEAPDQRLTLTREVSKSGRNSSRLNGKAASAGLLRLLSQHLVDLHGQHEHQSLLDPQN
ncbi:MAG: AAA family ATPase, partial [Acetobacteraceae bacterium]|nr:AAA family ATPase [Acetobacteraceae bacterium]